MLLQEEGDACKAICTGKGHWWGWQAPTLKPASRCQHPLLALSGVLHKGASEVKEDWSLADRAGRPSMQLREAELAPRARSLTVRKAWLASL